MSRGPGRIQKTMLDLIASDEDGAWTLSDICGHVHRGANRIEKKHRVAVARALRTMRLPETWAVYRLDKQGSEYVLVNRLSVDSQVKRRWRASYIDYTLEKWLSHYSHMTDKARDEVAEYRKYHEASEIGRIDIQIADEQKRAGLAKMIGAKPEFFEGIAKKIGRLQEDRRKAEERISVSASQTAPNGNTYQGGEA